MAAAIKINGIEEKINERMANNIGDKK